MTTIENVAALRSRVGQEIGTSDWMEIAQDRISAFADATDDHQWIHVDAERAKQDSPFGGTIAHGFLTLSLISTMMRNAVSIEGLRMAINYGLNRVRFISPVPEGSRVRARIALVAVEDTQNSVQATWSVTVEREGSDKPCLVAEWLVRYYAAHETRDRSATHKGHEGHEGHEGREG